ncbi:hypothetical protein B0H14DRAFT_3148311 [Mycena olivaceomarginata]|nr:hypothetical protein B0H14DRAFT_3148311 [Mycena olivaceomarginata]
MYIPKSPTGTASSASKGHVYPGVVMRTVIPPSVSAASRAWMAAAEAACGGAHAGVDATCASRRARGGPPNLEERSPLGIGRNVAQLGHKLSAPTLGAQEHLAPQPAVETPGRRVGSMSMSCRVSSSGSADRHAKHRGGKCVLVYPRLRLVREMTKERRKKMGWTEPSVIWMVTLSSEGNGPMTLFKTRKSAIGIASRFGPTGGKCFARMVDEGGGVVLRRRRGSLIKEHWDAVIEPKVGGSRLPQRATGYITPARFNGTRFRVIPPVRTRRRGVDNNMNILETSSKGPNLVAEGMLYGVTIVLVADLSQGAGKAVRADKRHGPLPGGTLDSILFMSHNYLNVFREGWGLADRFRSEIVECKVRGIVSNFFLWRGVVSALRIVGTGGFQGSHCRGLETGVYQQVHGHEENDTVTMTSVPSTSFLWGTINRHHTTPDPITG